VTEDWFRGNQLIHLPHFLVPLVHVKLSVESTMVHFLVGTVQLELSIRCDMVLPNEVYYNHMFYKKYCGYFLRGFPCFFRNTLGYFL
jgi:hypothetical protein